MAKKQKKKNSKPLRYHSKANGLPKQERLGNRGFLKRFFCTLPLYNKAGGISTIK